MKTIIIFDNFYSGAIWNWIEGLVDDGRWIRWRGGKTNGVVLAYANSWDWRKEGVKNWFSKVNSRSRILLSYVSSASLKILRRCSSSALWRICSWDSWSWMEREVEREVILSSSGISWLLISGTH